MKKLKQTLTKYYICNLGVIHYEKSQQWDKHEWGATGAFYDPWEPKMGKDRLDEFKFKCIQAKQSITYINLHTRSGLAGFDGYGRLLFLFYNSQTLFDSIATWQIVRRISLNGVVTRTTNSLLMARSTPSISFLLWMIPSCMELQCIVTHLFTSG